jgi:hypothetical protein
LIEKIRGDFTTKILALVDALGNLVRLLPMNSQLQRHCTDRSDAMFVLTPDLFA